MLISYIIPTHHREGVLRKHLAELQKQTINKDNFEVVVVNDGGGPLTFPDYNYHLTSLGQLQAGPATARNTGVAASKGEVALFVGDDVLPHPNLIYRHWLFHFTHDPCAVQGFTDWYPYLPPLDFENFLYESGLQANWASLKNQDGSWKKDAPGYCLTTNYSIHRDEIERLSKFDSAFPSAAWEDISLGFRGQKHSLNTFFEPDAINYHAHRQTLDGFIKRQQNEGRSRLTLCVIHPELAGGLLDTNALREFSVDRFQNAVRLARRLHFNNDPAIQPIRYQRWHDALQLASLSGIIQAVQERGEKCKVWLALPNLHTPDQVHHLVGIAGSLESGENGYAATASEWLLREAASNWAAWAVKGEVNLALGQKREAWLAFEKAVTLGPGEAWPAERLKEFDL